MKHSFIVGTKHHGWVVALSAILFACLSAGTTASAAWTMRAWQSDDGLPNNDIIGLAQTPDGYLWVANPSLVSRFDGMRFESFPLKIVAGREERISAILQSRKGGLWLGTDHGPVVYLNNGAITVISNNLPNATPNGLAEDSDGAIWVTYTRGGIACRIKGGVATQFASTDTNALNVWPGGHLESDLKGRIWFFKSGQIGTVQDDRFVPMLSPRRVPVLMAPARDGGMWICLGMQLWKCSEGGSGMHLLGTCGNSRTNAAPTALFEDHNGALWIGTAANGLFRYDASGFESVPTSHRRIRCLLEDREGNVWVGTGGGGLDRLQPRAIELEGVEAGLPFVALQSICQDTNGNIWAVTENGLFARKSGTNWTSLSGTEGWPLDGATCVVADRNGTIWLGTQNRTLYAWRNGQISGWIDTDGLDCTTIKAMFAASSGDLLIGGGDVLQRFRGDKFENIPLPGSVGQLTTMVEDHAGNIWIGTSRRRLLRLKGSTVYDETAMLSGSRGIIRTLHTTSDGTLWIGFAGQGLAWIQDGRFSDVTADDGLFDDYISQIVADDNGWLWIGSDHGIFKVRRQELENFADGQIDRIRSIRYGPSAGLTGLQAVPGNSPGALHSRDGKIWLPMSSALAIVDPGKLHDDTAPPRVLLKRITVGDHIVASYGGLMPINDGLDLQNPRAFLRLPPAHRRLEFEFTASSLTAPENVQFRYKLEGIDDKWMDPKAERSASYSRLPAGDYRFLVKACNSDGVWSTAGAALAFSVDPFVWQTWWFQTSVLGGFTFTVFALARFLYLHRIRMKMQQIEQQAALDRSRLAGMSEVASNVLHNVGNAINSVNVSTSLLYRQIRDSRMSGLSKVVALLKDHQTDLSSFLSSDPSGSRLPEYLDRLNEYWKDEQEDLMEQTTSLKQAVENISEIVARQQAYTSAPEISESLNLITLVEDAIRINGPVLEREHIRLTREYDKSLSVTTDRHKVLRILLNLISNSKHAFTNDTGDKHIIVRVEKDEKEHVKVSVIDNGKGIPADQLTRVFQQDFNRKDPGLGLHSGANAARELGGSLTAHSNGTGQGARFTLEIPAGTPNGSS